MLRHAVLHGTVLDGAKVRHQQVAATHGRSGDALLDAGGQSQDPAQLLRVVDDVALDQPFTIKTPGGEERLRILKRKAVGEET